MISSQPLPVRKAWTPTIKPKQNTDDGSALVVILKDGTKPCDPNIDNLKWVFSDPYFIVQVCEVQTPPDVPVDTPLTEEQYIDNYNMRKVLTFAAEGPYVKNPDGTLQPQFAWSNLPCIIVRDTSVSNITPRGTTDVDNTDNIIGGMSGRISTALCEASQADLYFLTHWLDACEKYVDVEGVRSIDRGSTLKWSVQPTSTQAIMYKPSSRDFFINQLTNATATLSQLINSYLGRGQLLGVVFVPNIIDFDIDLATSNNEFRKLNECDVVAEEADTSSAATFIWFIVIVALVILVAWALITLGPQYAPVNPT